MIAGVPEITHVADFENDDREIDEASIRGIHHSPHDPRQYHSRWLHAATECREIDI
jgi:hypothetical protein